MTQKMNTPGQSVGSFLLFPTVLSLTFPKMKLIVFLMLLALPASAGEWVSLFDGKTLQGWTSQGKANWAVNDGAITASEGEICLLTTDQKYENYELELEFRAALGTNSGVFLNKEAKVLDEAKDCYEVNIAPATNGFPTGSIVKFEKVEGQGEKDAWRKYELKVEKGIVTVILDGKKLITHKASKPRPAGFIGLQKNRGPIAFRNIRIREIK